MADTEQSVLSDAVADRLHMKTLRIHKGWLQVNICADTFHTLLLSNAALHAADMSPKIAGLPMFSRVLAVHVSEYKYVLFYKIDPPRQLECRCPSDPNPKAADVQAPR